jgi:hypothetical protein
MPEYVSCKIQKRKSLLLCILLNALAYNIMAQALDPHSSNVMGSTYKQETIMIDWSVGEQITTPTLLKNGFPIISTGYLQNMNADINTYKTLDSFLVKTIIGPNPTRDYFSIRLHQLGITLEQINILSLQGNIVSQIQGPYSGLNFNKIFDMSEKKEGVYLLQISFLIDGKYKKLKTYKILKTNL